VTVKALLLGLACIWSLTASGQVVEDFSDGDFISGPEWKGTTSYFQVNAAKQLQLNAFTAGLSYLVTRDTMLNNTQWDFFVRMAFSPSGSNFSRFYLSSDTPSLFNATGYFIQIGESGSTDGVNLENQEATTASIYTRCTTVTLLLFCYMEQ
jgi:hypothetical protein